MLLMNVKSPLEELRAEIDEIDKNMLESFAARARAVLKVGEIKRREAAAGSHNFIRSGREAAMMKKITSKGAGEFPARALASIWRIIISASLKLEGGLDVLLCFKGGFPEHKAVVDYFGSLSEYREMEEKAALGELLADCHKVAVFGAGGEWWLKLAEEEYSALKVFAALPFVEGEGERLFAVAKVTPEEIEDSLALAVAEDQEMEALAEKSGKRLVAAPVNKILSKKGYKVIGSFAKPLKI